MIGKILKFVEENEKIILIVLLVLLLFLAFGGISSCAKKNEYKKALKKVVKINEVESEKQQIESRKRIKELKKKIEDLAASDDRDVKVLELEEELYETKVKSAKRLEEEQASKAELIEQNAMKDTIITGQKNYIEALRSFYQKQKNDMLDTANQIESEYKIQIAGLKETIMILKESECICPRRIRLGGTIGPGLYNQDGTVRVSWVGVNLGLSF